MKIGIIFAMNEELEALKRYLILEKEYKIFELNFYEGKINDVDCVLVESGVGKVNSARTTQILIDNYKVDYIFNIGVAGGVDNSLEIGDVVIGNKIIQHDFDITAFNHPKGYVPKVGDYVVCDEYLIRKASLALPNSKIGTIASGDIFCTDKLMSKKINSKFDALCVEMEGASIAQVCYLSNVPFLIIRSISDVLDKESDNYTTYEEFLNKACLIIAKAMNDLIGCLGKDK